MDEFVMQKINESQCIVLSTSYISPLDEISTLQNQLEKHSCSGEVIIDLLLCNGVSDNRYVTMYFNGKNFDFSTLRVMPKVNDLITSISKSFYMCNKHLLTRGILPDAHRYIIEQGLI